MTILEAVLVTAVVSGSFYALLALALQVVFATTRVLNFAIGELAVLGMFAMWLTTTSWGLSAWVGLIFACAVGAGSGIVLYLACLRLTEGAPGFYSSLATFAFGAVLTGGVLVAFGNELHVVPPIVQGRAIHLAAMTITRDQMVLVGGAVVVMAGMWLLFQKTWYGLAMRAHAASHSGAIVVGIEPRMVALLACGISGGVAAFAGALLSPSNGAQFDLGTNYALVALVSALLGGIGSPIGCVFGACIVALIDASISATVGSQFSPLALLGVALVILSFRPNGLVSGRELHWPGVFLSLRKSLVAR